MKIALGRPARGTLATASVLFAAVIGAGSATAAPGGNNGRHLGQNPTAAPAPHGSVVRSQQATAAQDKAPGKAKAQAAKSAKATAQAAKKNDKPSKPAGKGQGNTNPASSVRGGGGDPPGNNGTVKIAALGDLDRIPNNTPHPGCSFEVQWYGFDGGSDVVSTVSFTPQAPTRDVTINVDGPTSVPVGGDAASGAGTATGLDAVQAYTLSFSGGAPAKQGYHVRLTVATPRSLGNDTKTKVFWVEPCDAAPEAPAAPAATAVPVVPATPTVTATPAAPLATPASIVGPPPRPDVPGTPAATPAAIVAPPAGDASPVPGRVGTSPSQGVPTAIDAGERRNALARAVSSPWGIGLIAGGAVLVALGAVVARRRV